MTNRGVIRGLAGPPTGDYAAPLVAPGAALDRFGAEPDYGWRPEMRRGGWTVADGPAVYNAPRNGSTFFRGAVARAATGGAPLHILCLGDSTTGGQIVGNTLNYPAQLRTMLDREQVFGRVRNGILPVSTTTVDENNVGGPQPQNVTSWSWTPSFPVTRFTLWYLTNPPVGPSTFNWNVDGGSNTAQSTSGTTNGITSLTINAGSLGTHTLNVAHVTGTATFLAGVEAWDDTIPYIAKVTRWGMSGSPGSTSTTVDYQNNPWWLFAPDMAVINFGINSGKAEGQLYQILKTQDGLAAARSCDVLHVVPNTLGTYLGDGTYGPYSKIREVIYRVAEEMGNPLVDIERRWSALTAAQRTTFDADGHPSGAGYHDIARLIKGALYTLAH